MSQPEFRVWMHKSVLLRIRDTNSLEIYDYSKRKSRAGSVARGILDFYNKEKKRKKSAVSTWLYSVSMTEQIATQTNNKEGETQVNSGVGWADFLGLGPFPTQTLVASSLFDIVYKSWARLKRKSKKDKKVLNLILGCLDNSREQGNWIPSLFAHFYPTPFSSNNFLTIPLKPGPFQLWSCCSSLAGIKSIWPKRKLFTLYSRATCEFSFWVFRVEEK